MNTLRSEGQREREREREREKGERGRRGITSPSAGKIAIATTRKPL